MLPAPIQEHLISPKVISGIDNEGYVVGLLVEPACMTDLSQEVVSEFQLTLPSSAAESSVFKADILINR